MKPPTPLRPLVTPPTNFGVVLSGGGARAAYQVGALRALTPLLTAQDTVISVIVGSSVGAINGLVLASGLNRSVREAVGTMEEVWRERTIRNTFRGSPSLSFLRALQVAILQLPSPGPNPTSVAIFDPSPLMQRIDRIIAEFGGLHPDERNPAIRAVAVMATVEDKKRRPLLVVSSKDRLSSQKLRGAMFEVCYVDNLVAAHAFASAALPSVLPPIKLNLETRQVRLVDGGISDNLPVDPAVRLGADKVISVDVSGRRWWFDRMGMPHYTRDRWEVPAEAGTFCLRPTDGLEIRNRLAFGPLLKAAIGQKSYISTLGPTWPIFKLLLKKLGEEFAFEVMSYVVVNADYIAALIDRGYEETEELVKAYLSSQEEKRA